MKTQKDISKKNIDCQEKDCSNKAHARGYCKVHYNKKLKRGDFYTGNNKDKICIKDGCDKPIDSRGLCKKHYTKFFRSGPMPKIVNIDKGCKIHGCTDFHEGLGYCKKHYNKYKRHGDPYYIDTRDLHDMSKSKEYKSWQHAKERCSNTNRKDYHRYGGRGIIMCTEWVNSFNKFYKYMGDKPFIDSQIDRIDNDGDYEPGNCRWTDRTTNIRNSSSIKKSIEIAREIRKLYIKGESKVSLANKFDCDHKDITSIINNKIWKEQ